MTASTIILSEKSHSYCEETFSTMMDICSDISGILISTVDGHAVAHRFTTEYDASRLAAMTSSMLSLGESITKEANQQHCRYVIVENASGYVLTLRVGKRLVLTAIAAREANLGLLRTATRSGAEKLATALTNKNQPT